jgi:hypothetical protein
MDQPVERLNILKNLAKYEDQILDAIAGTPRWGRTLRSVGRAAQGWHGT